MGRCEVVGWLGMGWWGRGGGEVGRVGEVGEVGEVELGAGGCGGRDGASIAEREVVENGGDGEKEIG